MKRLLYLTYLSTLLFLVSACEKENIMPSEAAVATDNTRTGACTSYFYTTKTCTVNLGNARSGYVLIDFDDNFSPTQQEQLLSGYSIFEALEPEFYMDSGLLSVARLDAQATCHDIEAMINQLHAHPSVMLATPIFEPFPAQQTIFEWMGLTGEFIVEMKTPNSYHKLQALALATNTTIVDNLFDRTYLLLADKNSLGTPLEVISTFNASNHIKLAEPNFIFQYLPFRSSQPGTPQLQTLHRIRLNNNALPE
ncbi:MAG TPA: hypothetical protein VK927_07065 [Adhaeribacter sp.]|nr:hypothetical protein [Adhaeribacter sp.]